MYRARILAVVAVALGVAALAILLREGRRAAEVGTGPAVAGGRVERCLLCHHGARNDPGGAHAAVALGCSSCHLGDPLAFTKVRAHAGMEPEPGALRTVSRTCGQAGCHPTEAATVATSLMATGRGIVGVDRFVFGELKDPDTAETIPALLTRTDPSPAEDHLRKRCAGCHLGTTRPNRDDAVSGGSGCAACHLGKARPGHHPAVDGRVQSDRCEGCHSRSGRISLSYQGLAEVKGPAEAACTAPVTLQDGRPACRRPADVHQRAGMQCVDCHLHTGVMGDGKAYAHAQAQVEITCLACHPRAGTRTAGTWAQVDDPLTRAILRLRGQARPPGEAVRTGRRGTPVWNLRPGAGPPAPDGGQPPWVLLRKTGGAPLPSPATPADAAHTLAGHARLACVTCHATWAPACTTCHTGYDPGGRQWDFAAGRPTQGAWEEHDRGFATAPPVLGVAAGGEIVPMVPGMILTLDAGAAGGPKRRVRLFAPLDPHTTQGRGRTCASCHLSAWALGLGTGRLTVGARAVRFVPDSPVAGGLAADGWTPLFPATPGQGTRVGARSLDATEQWKVLRVGACLPCHDGATSAVYRDFAASLKRLEAGGTRCPFRSARWLRTPPGDPPPPR